MSALHEPYLDLCAAQALGCLDPGDARLLEEHLLAGCPECEAELAELSKAVVLLAASASPASPRPALRSRVMAEAAGLRAVLTLAVEPLQPAVAPPAAVVPLRPRRAGPLLRWAPSALAAGLAVAAVAQWSQVTRLGEELRSSRERLGQLEQQAAEARQRLQEERTWAAVLGSFDTCIVPLTTTADAPVLTLRARAIYEPTTQRAVLLVENLKAPSGRDYQLWAIRDKTPRSLGLIRTDASGHAVLRLEHVGEKAAVSAFAISLEPEGGAPTPTKPTGPVVLVGSVPA